MFQKLRTLQNLKVELWLTEVSKHHKLKKEGVNYGESDSNDSVRFFPLSNIYSKLGL